MYEEGKRSYCQDRGMIYVPGNKKGNKLKHSIKYLEVYNNTSNVSSEFCRIYYKNIIFIQTRMHICIYIYIYVCVCVYIYRINSEIIL